MQDCFHLQSVGNLRFCGVGGRRIMRTVRDKRASMVLSNV